MAGKKSSKGKGTYNVYLANDQFQKNRTRKLKRHIAKFPNDDVAIAALKTPGNIRQKPMTKGHFPPKARFIRDEAGHKIPMPAFAYGTRSKK
jgi:hypothetical protein